MDKLDFEKTNICELFFRMFIPTLLGMVFTTSLVICDGIFVGRGVGSDALAAINITMPIFMTLTGIGLMFGIGASVVASVHLSQSRVEDANICLTQSITISTILVIFISAITITFKEWVIGALGGSEALSQLVLEYIHVLIPFTFMQILLIAGQFIIRMDGSPNYAMLCNVIPAVINIVLDYIFIFIFGWGVSGAALASVIGMFAGTLLFLIYMVKFSKILSFRFCGLYYRNIKNMINNIITTSKIGFSALLSDLAMSCMFLMGNHVFIRNLGKDGVAAFSVVCYLFPLIFMVTSSIVQSAQPIISFNYGNGENRRILKTVRLSLFVASIFSAGVSVAFMFFSPQIVSLFLEKTTQAHAMAVYGMPYFATGFIFFSLNMVLIGYYQSIELANRATAFTFLRGFILMAACFAVLPALLGIKGIWAAVPLAELITFLAIIICHNWTRNIHFSHTVRQLNSERAI